MTPHLGQGSGQAIEDAVVLAHLAEPGGDTAAAVAAYSVRRQLRTTDVMRRSRPVGRPESSRPAGGPTGGTSGPRRGVRGAAGGAGRGPG
ncbi:hypothetical protein [Streptomyces sp. MI02-7b]|nr:hypothetical protein [Streptomyces sp. MI02-7b]MDX3076203.1 hypothetical protein [Streptomyces sp. MI02-7b]